jgi:hypothetical protein
MKTASLQFVTLHSDFCTSSLSSATLSSKGTDKGRRSISAVAEEKTKKVTNEISDGTGQFDARFVLWRQFCGDNDIPVETLPSALTGDIKDKWEKLKNERLKKTDK